MKRIYVMILLISFGWWCPFAAAAQPIITHVNSNEIIADETVNLFSSSATVSGSGNPGDSLEILVSEHTAARLTIPGTGNWETTISNLFDGLHSLCAVVNTPPQPPQTSNKVSLLVDTSQNPQPPSYAFRIATAGSLHEKTTAQTQVFISLLTNDPEGITSAQISNDGIIWEAWPTPALSPETHPWLIPDSPGNRVIYMKFFDSDGNESDIISEEIGYYPTNAIVSGSRESGIYPVNTYDEYQGQNKYGEKRTTPTTADHGSSLQITSP